MKNLGHFCYRLIFVRSIIYYVKLEMGIGHDFILFSFHDKCNVMMRHWYGKCQDAKCYKIISIAHSGIFKRKGNFQLFSSTSKYKKKTYFYSKNKNKIKN